MNECSRDWTLCHLHYLGDKEILSGVLLRIHWVYTSKRVTLYSYERRQSTIFYLKSLHAHVDTIIGFPRLSTMKWLNDSSSLSSARNVLSSVSGGSLEYKPCPAFGQVDGSTSSSTSSSSGVSTSCSALIRRFNAFFAFFCLCLDFGLSTVWPCLGLPAGRARRTAAAIWASREREIGLCQSGESKMGKSGCFFDTDTRISARS